MCKELWNYCLGIAIVIGAFSFNAYQVHAEEDCRLPDDHWAATCSIPEWYNWDSGGTQCVINACGNPECFTGSEPVVKGKNLIFEGTDQFNWWNEVIE
ncbi:MAG: hypothetical protein GF393_12885 [Armatimonadia bacterium]|nr:hypothetical protein [Armatimonadia bacterium]